MTPSDTGPLRYFYFQGREERFNVSSVALARGRCELLVSLPFGDERDDDPMFVDAAIRFAVDIVCLEAVMSEVDHRTTQANGTASLHLNVLEEPSGPVTVIGRVAHLESHEALAEIEVLDATGHAIARGFSRYSLRPIAERAP